MRAWLMDGYEGVEKLHLADVPVPEPGPGQVLLKVRFAALNPADAFLAQAMYPAKPPLPHVLGRDGVGDVVAVGTGVDKALMGRIVGVVRSSVGVEAWGTLAENTVVSAGDIVPVPQGWTLEEMAGAPLVFLTAWQALTQWNEPPSPPRAGSVLLVTGASGGVGRPRPLSGTPTRRFPVSINRSCTSPGQILRRFIGSLESVGQFPAAIWPSSRENWVLRAEWACFRASETRRL